MLILAGGGLSITGALVVYGALTGRLAAMLAAVFRPADLNTGYYVAPGVVDPLNTIGETKPPASSGGTTTSIPGFLGTIAGVPLPGAPKNPAPLVAPAPDPARVRPGGL